MEEESKLKQAWGVLPLKYKLIIIGIVAVVISVIMFLVVMITPLMELGIIDISDLGGGVASSAPGYSSISGNTTYWWPIGSSTTTTIGGATYANGDPTPTTITAHYGNDVLLGESRNHGGMDIAANDGSYGTINIIAARDGKVLYPSNSDYLSCPSNSDPNDSCGYNFGNYVMIEHSDGTVTVYAHLYENSITVRTGDTVKQGQVIGKMGSSGQSTGSHLHFEVRVNGNKTNPENYVDVNNPRPSGGAINYVTGDSNKQSVCLTLRSSGIPDNGVAAIMTNMNHESAFNPTALGDGGTSYGLCQWHNGRYDNLMTSFPGTYQTVGSQIEFLMYELENSYTSVYNSIMNESNSVYDSTYAFCANFEIPYDTDNTCRSRANNSDSYETYVKSGCQ